MKTLFIGNSHTYFNDMPYIFTSLCASRGVFVSPVMLSRGGEFLEKHLRSEQVLFNLRYGDFDMAVIQENESEFPGEETYAKNVGEFVELTKNAGTSLALYENFAPKGDFARQEMFCDVCGRTAARYGLPYARAGSAFLNVQKRHPEIELHFTDKRHASVAGSYLVALTLMRDVLGLEVAGLPSRIERKGTVVNEIDQETAAILQRTVTEL